jgi:serine/threonine protein kinase
MSLNQNHNQIVLSFFSAETEANLLSDEDPKMSLDVDKDSRKRNVFRATVRSTGKPVAVKILQFKVCVFVFAVLFCRFCFCLNTSMQDTRQKTLFMREIRIVKDNASPCLMRFRGAYKVANKLWMVTDWIDGGTLKVNIVVVGQSYIVLFNRDVAVYCRKRLRFDRSPKMRFCIWPVRCCKDWTHYTNVVLRIVTSSRAM